MTTPVNRQRTPAAATEAERAAEFVGVYQWRVWRMRRQSAVLFLAGRKRCELNAESAPPDQQAPSTKRALAFSCHLSLARAGDDEPLDEPRGGRGGGAPGRGNGGPPDGGGDTRPRGGDHQVSQDTQNLNFATTAPASRSVRRRRAASECWVIIHDDHSCRQQARCDCTHPPSHTASMCGGSVGYACRGRSCSTRE